MTKLKGMEETLTQKKKDGKEIGEKNVILVSASNLVVETILKIFSYKKN